MIQLIDKLQPKTTNEKHIEVSNYKKQKTKTA